MHIPPEVLLSAYAHGVFPMAARRGNPVVSPRAPRLDPARRPLSHPPRTQARAETQTLRDPPGYRFPRSHARLRRPRRDLDRRNILESYCQLHQLGHAHSVECWDDDGLQGGLYGVALPGVFFGESMFSRKTDASKIALVALVDHLRALDFMLLDTQWMTPHLRQFGGYELTRKCLLNSSFPMKPRPLFILAGAVLWLGTLIGAYQLGQRKMASQPESSVVSAAAAANSRNPGNSRSGSDAAGRGSLRPADKPQTVKQLFTQLKATMRPGSMQNPMVMMRALALLDKLRPEDLPEALREAEAMKDQQSKMMVFMAVLGKWAEQDGPAAMKYAEDHATELGPTGAVLKMSVVGAWAEQDPDAVWAWYQGNKDKDSGGMFGGNQMVLMSVFSNLMANDPDTAFKRLDELSKESRTMALAGMSQTALFDDTKRQALLDRIKIMPDAAERSQARQMLVSQWVMLAPDDATAWVAQQPAEEQKEMRESIGTALLMSDPKKGAAFMLEGATAEDKPTIYAKVVGGWAAMNQDAAATWLGEQGDGPELDQARSSLAFAMSDRNPAVAMANVRAITDADLRFTAASTVYAKWQATDAAAADQAIDNAGLTAEQVQQIRSASDQ
jgi:leucyl/phenylalanyl-tRNA---protein transferase